MKLSILVPSKRPEGLLALINSIKTNSVTDDIELVVLVDDEREYVEFHHNMIVIHYLPKYPVSVAHLLHQCFKMATGDWIMFGNDDIICETPSWDKLVFQAIKQFGKEDTVLFWPDDGMFGNRLACFPIVSKKLLEKIDFFPQPYQRYKVDDTLYHIIPPKRRYYLSNVKFKHDNDHGESGFDLGNGRIYPIIQDAAKHDEEQWLNESANRMRMKKIINKELGINTPKILLGVPTQEMARRADFYDAINLLQIPEGVEFIKTFSHGQSPAKGRNVIIEEALKNDCTHVLFVDDDVYPQPDAVLRLLFHDKDIVTGLYLSRSYPHRPYIFSKANPDGSCQWDFLYDGRQGLIEVVGAGMGLCLIKTPVFLALEKPWIRLGELESDNWCDDLGFFKRTREAGFKMYCDLDCIAAHAFSGKVFPKYVDGKWFSSINTQGLAEPAFPQLYPTNVISEPKKEEEENALAQSGIS